MKRIFDITFSTIALVLFFPILFLASILIFLEDRQSPFYVSSRVGQFHKLFNIIKLRSMVIGADLVGASSTSNNDQRITRIGRYIRKYKIDELSQFWNVLRGDMSIVGPRPQVLSGVNEYTAKELHLLDARPGITDFASIIFSDEGDILEGKSEPDLAYNQLIRPWKSKLGLIYIRSSSLLLDTKLILFTLVALANKKLALRGIVNTLRSLDVDPELIQVSTREQPLSPSNPIDS